MCINDMSDRKMEYLIRDSKENYTDLAMLPNDVCRKIIACRNALILGDIDEAFHYLYSIADPEFSSLNPWARIER